MKEWGLTNVAVEPWTPCPADAARRGGCTSGPGGGGRGADRPASCGFPRGWTNEKFYLAAVAPQQFPIPGTPTGWTPGTNGLVRGDASCSRQTRSRISQLHAGQLKGKWLLRAAAPDVAAYWNAPAHRYTQAEARSDRESSAPGEFGVTPPGGGARARPRADAARQAAPATRTPCGGRGGRRGSVRDSSSRPKASLGVLSTAPRGHGIYTIGGSAATRPGTA